MSFLLFGLFPSLTWRYFTIIRSVYRYISSQIYDNIIVRSVVLSKSEVNITEKITPIKSKSTIRYGTNEK